MEIEKLDNGWLFRYKYMGETREFDFSVFYESLKDITQFIDNTNKKIY